jgi:hypothetical protein
VLSALGLQLDAIDSELNNTAKGALAEQFIAQHLLDDRELFQRPQLHYWQRQKAGSTAEIDFLAVHQGKVVPIEVKSGASGAMKSLQVFMSGKDSHGGVALRFLNNLPERQDVPLVQKCIIGELYSALITNGQVATEVNQSGYNTRQLGSLLIRELSA